MACSSKYSSLDKLLIKNFNIIMIVAKRTIDLIRILSESKCSWMDISSCKAYLVSNFPYAPMNYFLIDTLSLVYSATVCEENGAEK